MLIAASVLSFPLITSAVCSPWSIATNAAPAPVVTVTGGLAQPDVTRAGGIAECLRVADYARRHGKRCVLHAWSTGIIKAATLQVLAAMEEAEYMEYCVQTTDLNQRLVAERFPLVEGEVKKGELS